MFLTVGGGVIWATCFSGSLNGATAQATEQLLSQAAPFVKQEAIHATQQDDMAINSTTTPQTDAWQYRQQEQYQSNTPSENKAENSLSGRAEQSQTESVGDKYPKFDKLLGRHEGGYDDFNAKNGSKYTAHRGEEIADGKKLSDLTVGEVMQMQKNGELNAAGHYQITKDAMIDAVRLSGVSTDEKFSPEIQDKLFEDGLLKKAGAGKLYDYITGKSDDIDKAMLATAQEWAAFPVPHDMHVSDKFGERDLKAGDSYYEGVKGNHSNMSLEDAKAAIEEMRANYLAAHSENNQTESTAKSAENLTVESVNQSDNQVSGSLKDNGQPEKHSQNNQTTQTADNAVKSPEVSGSLNKLPTDHLPKGVNRVSVKEIYSTKLCSDYDPIKEFNVAVTPVPCGANNPYQYNTPEYWIWEWTGHANGWEKAFEIARQGKICQWNDAKTAAEHYIVAQRLQNDPDKSELEKIAHRTFLPLYGLAYEGAWKGVPHLLHKVGIKKDRPTTSNPSYQQLQYHFKGWWDGLPDNFNKNIDVKFGVCIPKKDKK